MERSPQSSSNQSSPTVLSASTSRQPNLIMERENDSSYPNQNARDHSSLGRALVAHPSTSTTNQSAQQSTPSSSSNNQNHAAKRFRGNNQSTAAPNEADDIESDSDSDDSVSGGVWQDGRYLLPVENSLFSHAQRSTQMEHRPQLTTKPASRTRANSIELINLESDESEIDSEDDDEDQENRENWQCHLSNDCDRVFSNHDDLVRHVPTYHRNVVKYKIWRIGPSSESTELDAVSGIEQDQLTQQEQQSSANSNHHHHSASSASGTLNYAAIPIKRVNLNAARKIRSSELPRVLTQLEASNLISHDEPSTVDVMLENESIDPIEQAQVRVPNGEAHSLLGQQSTASGSLPQTANRSRQPTVRVRVGANVRRSEVSILQPQFNSRPVPSASGSLSSNPSSAINQATNFGASLRSEHLQANTQPAARANWPIIPIPIHACHVNTLAPHSNWLSQSHSHDQNSACVNCISLSNASSSSRADAEYYEQQMFQANGSLQDVPFMELTNTGVPVHTNGQFQYYQQQMFSANRGTLTNASNTIPNPHTTGQQQQQPAARQVSVIVRAGQPTTHNQGNNPTQNVPHPQLQANNNASVLSFLGCNHCPHIARSKGELIEHKENIHKVGLYECLIDGCSQSFSKGELNTQHRADDHKDALLNGFKCKVCHKPYTNYRSLQSHYNKKHNTDRHVCSLCRFESFSERRVFDHINERHPARM